MIFGYVHLDSPGSVDFEVWVLYNQKAVQRCFGKVGERTEKTYSVDDMGWVMLGVKLVQSVMGSSALLALLSKSIDSGHAAVVETGPPAGCHWHVHLDTFIS